MQGGSDHRREFSCKTRGCPERVVYEREVVVAFAGPVATGSRSAATKTVYLTCSRRHRHPYLLSLAGRSEETEGAQAPVALAGVPEPKVDHQFWFDFSAKLVGSAIERRDEAAGRLQSLIVWLWTIYTATAAAGFALTERELPTGLAVLVAAPSVLLVLAYFATVWARNPVLREFDPRVPEDIEARLYSTTVRRKQWRLGIALSLAGLAAAGVACALVAAALHRSEGYSYPVVEASLEPLDETFHLVATTRLPKGKEICVRFRVEAEGAGSWTEPTCKITDEVGRIDSLKVPEGALRAKQRATVEFGWRIDTEPRIRLTQDVLVAGATSEAEEDLSADVEGFLRTMTSGELASIGGAMSGTRR